MPYKLGQAGAFVALVLDGDFGTMATSAPAGRVTNTDFEARLIALIGREEVAVVGRVHLFGLDRILGDPAIPNGREKFDQCLERAVDPMFATLDFSTVRGEDLFVVFHAASLQRTEDRCATIANNLLRRLYALLDKARTITAGVAAGRVDWNLHFAEGGPLEGLKTVLPVDPRFALRPAAGGRLVQAPGAVAPDEGVGTDNGAAADPPPSGGFADATPVLPEVAEGDKPALIYRPVWNIRQELLSMSLCRPALRHPDGRKSPTELAMSPHAAYLQDQDMLRVMVEDCHHWTGRPDATLIILPIHFTTLAEGRYAEMVTKVGELFPEAFRHRLIYEVVGLPANAPQPLLQDISGRLAAMGRAVMARVDPAQHRLGPLRSAGFAAAGLDAEDFPDEHELLVARDIQGFTRAAGTAGLKSYVHNLQSLEVASAALFAGMDYMDGPCVRPDQDTPPTLTPFTTRDLMAPMLDKDGTPKV